jgi:hypothetical protein
MTNLGVKFCGYFLLGALSCIQAAEADFPQLGEQQTILEWNSQSDEVGSSHVSTSRLAFEALAKNYFKASEADVIKIPDTATLNDFSAQLKNALQKPGAKPQEVLRIFVNSHGNIDSFLSHDANTPIYWDDFVSAIATELKNSKARPKVLELYLSPCYSGSIIPSLKARMQQAQVGGVEVNVWTGSSGFTTTSSPEFPESIQAFANLKFTLDKYLLSNVECAEFPKHFATNDNVNLIHSLGGISYSDFWTNSGKVYREFLPEELERLLHSGNSFLEERALTSLLRKEAGSAGSAPAAAAILKNSTKDYYLRTLAAEYLGQLPKNEISLPTLLEIAKDPLAASSAHAIQRAAIEAIGYADPAAAPLLIEMFRDPAYAAHKGSVLISIGATRDPEGLAFIKPYLQSADPSLKHSAQSAYFRSRPREALDYFEGKLKSPSTGSQERYGVYAALKDRMPSEIAPLVGKLLTKEHERVDGTRELDVVQMAGAIAKQYPATREVFRKDLLPRLQAYTKAYRSRKRTSDFAEERLLHASRLLEVLLEN